MKDLRSKVEINKDLVEVGTLLVYSDSVNYMTYKVLDVDSDSFECLNIETNQDEVYFFNELQHGWNFK